MGNYNFKKDLIVANKTEKEVAELLHNEFCFDIVEFGNNNEFDIKATFHGIELTFEIKEDFFCHKSGNVALEFESRGKISGIQTSKADSYIYKIHSDRGIIFVAHDIRDLKKKIANNKYFRIVSGGDKGSNTKNYLFKLDEFLKDGLVIAVYKQ